MRIRYKILITIIIVIIVVSGALSAWFFLPKTAQRIFRENLTSIVELKCVTNGGIESFGSAVIISKDGEMITNAHVVTYSKLGQATEFDNYFIRFANETSYREVQLIKYDVDKDLAIIKLNQMPDFKLKPVKFGNSDKIKSGQKVYAIGNTMNYGISITQGVIGAPQVNIKYADIERNVIQCDLTIAEGNSGGALLDSRGKLIGITTFRVKDTMGNVVYGIAYSIPIKVIEEFI